MNLFYEFFRWLALITAWPAHLLFFKKKVYYEDKRAQSRFVKGAALVISNHYGVLDFFLTILLFPFRKLYVVLSEMPYKRNRFYGFGMRFFGGVRADRDVMSMHFIDESVEVLESGGLLQIYPEAHNTPDGQIQPFKPSYIMIALRAGVPILPVILDGNYGFFKRTRVMIGKKIDLADYCSSLNPTKEEITALNELVMAKVAELKRELDSQVFKKAHEQNKLPKEGPTDD